VIDELDITSGDLRVIIIYGRIQRVLPTYRECAKNVPEGKEQQTLDRIKQYLVPIATMFRMSYGEIKVTVTNRMAEDVLPSFDYYTEKIPNTKR
jgi:hypothetical protein